MPELILKDEVYEVMGAAMDVFYQLGRGFLEPVYQEALEIELGRRAYHSNVSASSPSAIRGMR